MDRDQFTRVVMLPQGDFAAFLRSKAADRLELLQSLFGTQRFEAVEQELARRAADSRAEVASLNNQLELLLAQARAEAAPPEQDLPGALPEPEDPEELLDWLQESAAARAAALQSAADQAEAQRTGSAKRTRGRRRPRRPPGETLRRGTAAGRPQTPPRPSSRKRPSGLACTARPKCSVASFRPWTGPGRPRSGLPGPWPRRPTNCARRYFVDPELAALSAAGGQSDGGPGAPFFEGCGRCAASSAA